VDWRVHLWRSLTKLLMAFGDLFFNHLSRNRVALPEHPLLNRLNPRLNFRLGDELWRRARFNRVLSRKNPNFRMEVGQLAAEFVGYEILLVLIGPLAVLRNIVSCIN
jgi:hypothetical protein